MALAGILLFVAVACGDSPERALGPDPYKIVVPLEQALSLLKGQKYAEATDALRPHATALDAPIGVQLAYAHSLTAANRSSLAIWPLQRIVEHPEGPPAARRLFISALLNGGAQIESIQAATDHLEQHPDDRAVRSLRSQGYEATLDLERAVEDMEIIVAEWPDEARPVERLLNLLIKIEDWDGARERIAELRVLLAREGVSEETKAQFCATASRFESDRGNPEVAEAELRSCLIESPGDRNLIFSLVALLDQSDRRPEGTAYLEEMSKEFPRRPNLQIGLAHRYRKLNRHADADAVLVASAKSVGLADVWIALAELRVARGELAGAADAVDTAVEIALGGKADDPGLAWSRLTPESRFGLAEVYIRAGKLAVAERMIDTLSDEPAFQLLLRARIKLENREPAKALEDFQEAFKQFPSNPAARYLAARAALEVGDFDQAIGFYQDALRADPTATDAGLVLGQMLIAVGRVAWAIDTLSFFSGKNPDNPHAIRMMALAGDLAGNHKWAESIRAVLSNDAAWAGISLADQAKQLARTSGSAKAKEYLESSPALEEPGLFEAFSVWAGLARSMGEGDEARTRARKLKTDFPDKAGAWISWSRILYEDGEKAEAIEAIRRAIELDSLLSTAHAELGEMLLAEGEVDAGILELDQAAVLDTADARPEVSAVRALIDADRNEEAAKRLRKMLIEHPWHGEAALMWVDMERKKGPLDEWMYQVARRAALYVSVSGPRAHAELGEIELRRENFEAARASFANAIGSKHEIANSSLGMARALVGLERRAEALGILSSVISSPDLDDVVSAAALLEELSAEAAES